MSKKDVILTLLRDLEFTLGLGDDDWRAAEENDERRRIGARVRQYRKDYPDEQESTRAPV